MVFTDMSLAHRRVDTCRFLSLLMRILWLAGVAIFTSMSLQFQRGCTGPSMVLFRNAPQAHLAAPLAVRHAQARAQQDTIAQQEVRLQRRTYALYHLSAQRDLARRPLAPAQHSAQQQASLWRQLALLALSRSHLGVTLANGLRILNARQPL